MLHNHPGQSNFSLNDLGLYIRLNSLKTITIVTNKGQVKYITKTNKYVSSDAIDLLAKHFIIKMKD